jgi:hypothetical protein
MFLRVKASSSFSLRWKSAAQMLFRDILYSAPTLYKTFCAYGHNSRVFILFCGVQSPSRDAAVPRNSVSTLRRRFRGCEPCHQGPFPPPLKKDGPSVWANMNGTFTMHASQTSRNIGVKPFAVRNLITALPSTYDHNVRRTGTVLNACDFLRHRWSWWRWTVSPMGKARISTRRHIKRGEEEMGGGLYFYTALLITSVSCLEHRIRNVRTNLSRYFLRALRVSYV